MEMTNEVSFLPCLSFHSFSSVLFSELFDFVFDLESCEPLMVKHLSDLASIEPEMGSWEVHQTDDTHEQNKPRVVTLTLLFERL